MLSTSFEVCRQIMPTDPDASDTCVDSVGPADIKKLRNTGRQSAVTYKLGLVVCDVIGVLERASITTIVET